MMSQNNTVTEHSILASGIQLEDLLEYIDELHTAASENESESFTGMSDSETISYLRDIIYTATEALNELEAAKARRNKKRKQQPVLRIVEKIDKAG